MYTNTAQFKQVGSWGEVHRHNGSPDTANTMPLWTL